MGERSFLKGYCPKKNRYFGMTIEKFDDRWEVVDFIPLNESEAKAVCSLQKQDYFETHNNLLKSVDDSVGRRILSSIKIKCPKDDKTFSFQCIYCKEMQLSYENDIDGSGYKEGEVIKLSQGQEILISSSASPLKKIRLEVGWDPTKKGKNMDIDSSILEFDHIKRPKKGSLTYFFHLISWDFAIVHHGDNLTGSSFSDVDEVITIRLDRIKKYNKVAILINIYSGQRRGQTFGTVKNLFVRVFDTINKKQLCDYTIDSGTEGSCGLVIGLLNRTEKGWTFKALNDSIKQDDVDYLKQYVINKYA